VADWEPMGDFEAFRHSPLRMVLSADRPPYETMGALVCHGLFDRFPRIRVASIEAGASWVPVLLKKLKKAYGQMPSSFASDPVETFRAHVWVAPFYEDDLGALKDDIGLDHLLFGSDWPHAEGMAHPKDFFANVASFTLDEQKLIMRENARRLTFA
jgi:predicted TIM-barrel fold metal-dependent hydrolase